MGSKILGIISMETKAFDILRNAEEGGEGGTWLAFEYFQVYIALGRYDEALEWAEKMSPIGLIFLNVERIPQSLREDPRFQELLGRVGIESQ